MCIYKHVSHTRLENIKNEGFLLRRFYDRKRAPFCHLYALGIRVSTWFEILKGKREDRKGNEKENRAKRIRAKNKKVRKKIIIINI